MIRRNFIQKLTVGGATGLVLLPGADANAKKNVTYKVSGFTCLTCAIGLEVVLKQQQGVTEAKANYPDATVAIGFDPDVTSEESLKKFILTTGFTVEVVLK